MEGTLLTPPDRGTFIGRAVWKPRYIVIGNQHRDAAPSVPALCPTQVLSANRTKARGDASKLQQRSPLPLPDAVYISIFKSKDDWEPVQQHSMASITDCQVQMIAHRKQGPVLPTLIIQISPDPATDKLRKRRSSRTAGLTTTRDSGPTTLWFRTGDDLQYSLQDWARCISSLTQPVVPDMMPMSPISPVSPTFINPFAPRDTAEFAPRPSSGKQESARPPMQHNHSAQSHIKRDRPLTFSSGSPSLRSKKSDLSSQASGSVNAMGMGYVMHAQHYNTAMPTDLPSPATTIGEYQGEYMLGWTSAQGRSSTLASPVRTRGSVSSQGQQQSPPLSSSPPAPRETILDRAFQLRCIPGSEREIPGEEKLGSLARFEALMRENESRRKDQELAAASSTTKSMWEEDASDDEDPDDGIEREDDEDFTDEDGFEEEAFDDRTAMFPSAQRSLHYITNRHSTISQSGRTSLSFRADTRTAETGSSVLRPHTAHSKMRPTMSPRASSQPQFAMGSLELPPIPGHFPDENYDPRHNHETRLSTSSVKRLSFNEFSKRLSSSSSLLLVQTNVSNGSSRGSAEVETTQSTTPRGGLNARSPRTHDQEKYNWRGSVGVFGGGEGGFL